MLVLPFPDREQAKIGISVGFNETQDAELYSVFPDEAYNPSLLFRYHHVMPIYDDAHKEGPIGAIAAEHSMNGMLVLGCFLPGGNGPYAHANYGFFPYDDLANPIDFLKKALPIIQSEFKIELPGFQINELVVPKDNAILEIMQHPDQSVVHDWTFVQI